MAETTRKPKYVQVAAHLRELIRNGELKIGDRLPSYVEMHRQFGAGTATAQRVCDLLEREQVVERRKGSGVYVAAPKRRALTKNIGLLLRTIKTTDNSTLSLHVEALLSGIREGCREHGVEILLIDDKSTYAEKTDGILIFCDKLEAYAMGIPAEFPHVMLSQHAEGIASVIADDFSAGKTATSHLIAKGHRRIACLMEELMDEPIQRIAGYHSALLEAGIEADPRWLTQTRKTSLSPSLGYRDWGRQNMRAWLNEDWDQLDCTAIVVQNDHAAIGVMQLLQEAGIDVPGQISVIGFDGTNLCDLVSPRLTSIQVPFYRMGYEAVRVLCEQIQYGSQAPQKIILPIKLREGDSVSKIN